MIKITRWTDGYGGACKSCGEYSADSPVAFKVQLPKMSFYLCGSCALVAYLDLDVHADELRSRDRRLYEAQENQASTEG